VLADLSLPDSQGLATFERVQPPLDEPHHRPTGLDDEEVRSPRTGAQDYLVGG
jgi:hypothetical protein